MQSGPPAKMARCPSSWEQRMQFRSTPSCSQDRVPRFAQRRRTTELCQKSWTICKPRRRRQPPLQPACTVLRALPSASRRDCPLRDSSSSSRSPRAGNSWTVPSARTLSGGGTLTPRMGRTGLFLALRGAIDGAVRETEGGDGRPGGPCRLKGISEGTIRGWNSNRAGVLPATARFVVDKGERSLDDWLRPERPSA